MKYIDILINENYKEKFKETSTCESSVLPSPRAPYCITL